MKIVLTLCLLIFSFGFNTFAKSGHSEEHAEEESHEHGEEKHKEHEEHGEHKENVTGAKPDDHDDHSDHEEKKDSHADHDEEGHDEEGHGEENPQVGKGKGITEASESEGIKLSPEATKNFEIALAKIDDLKSIKIPKKAIVTAGEEVNIFRYRDGFYKRIDFELIKKENDQVYIRSKDFKSSDQIVIGGTGFLRIAEIAAFGGAPEGHSH